MKRSSGNGSGSSGKSEKQPRKRQTPQASKRKVVSSIEDAPKTQNPRPPSVPLPPPITQDLTVNVPAPVIGGLTPLAAAFRFITPSWRNYIMYVDLESRTGNEDAKRYLSMWNALSLPERRSHMPEQLCDLANIPASDLIRWVSGQAWQESAAKSSLCMSFMRDQVLEKTGEFAMASPDNYKHADLFMRASGVLPTGGGGRGGAGSQVHIFNAPVASSGSVAGVVSDSSPSDRSGLRDMDAEIVELSRVMQTGSTECDAERVPDEPPDPDDEEDEGDEDDGDDD